MVFVAALPLRHCQFPERAYSWCLHLAALARYLTIGWQDMLDWCLFELALLELAVSYA